MNNLMWLTNVRISKLYIIKIRIYLFFSFTDKLRGTKNEQSNVATYGGISNIYIIQILIYPFFCFTDKVSRTKTQQYDVATYVKRIHVYIFFWVCFEHSTVAAYGGTSKLFIIHIRFYLLFCFTDKVRGTKTEHSDVATYGGIIHVYIFFAYSYLDNV